MAQPVLDDALWSLIEPQLPPSVARPKRLSENPLM